MPLINFRTNLTNLKYGMDRPGGGDSGQPFVQFPIENADTPSNIKKYYETNRTSLDFPVRGGAISQLVDGGFGIISSTIDRERIEAFFNSAPRGKAFLEKQRGLQLTNPRLQVPNALSFAGGGLGNVNIPVTNVYNSVNTLAQVQAMGTGAHFNRHGVAPTIYENPQSTYAYIVANNNTETTNRLTILKALKLLKNTNFLVNSSTATGLGIDSALVTRLGISTIQNQLFNYQGGPGSVYGIGVTRIFRYTNTEATDILTKNTAGFTIGGNPEPTGVSKPYSAIALTYQQLAEQTTRSTNPRSPVQAKIQDFREQTNGGNPVIPFSDYRFFNIADADLYNIGIGNPGAPTGRISYTTTSTTGEDRVNMINPFLFNPQAEDPWTAGNRDNNNNTNDIIKFAFECIDNDNSAQSYALIFRAFLEGAITDSNQASYNEFKYLGRGETFRTYQGFNRSIGFTFKMFAQSRQELLPMYQKLNHLMSQVYPDYSPAYNLMRGNVVRLTIGDYLYRVPGFLDSINITIDNSNTPWEIVLNQYINLGVEEDDVRQLPHIVTIQCNFLPIMDLLPRKVSKNNPFVPLIVNGDHFLDPSATDNILKKAQAYPKTNSTAATSAGPIAPNVGIQTNTQVATQAATTPAQPAPVTAANQRAGRGAASAANEDILQAQLFINRPR